MSADIDAWKVSQVLLWVAAGSLGLALAPIKWIAARSMERIDALEQNSVTKTDWQNSLRDLREERLRLHTENRETLQRIEDKIDANEAHAANTRHDLRDSVHNMALQVAVLARDVQASKG